jgi:hypothetical protein
MRVRQQLQFLLVVVYVSVCLWLLPPVQAGPPGKIVNDAQLREAVAQAVRMTHPGAADASVKIQPRADLDEDLSRIAGKAGGNVSFFETATAPAVPAAKDDPVWAVVSGDSPQESYKLYSFDNSESFEQSSQEFNRLISQLALSLDNKKAASLAQFFLGCCNRGTHGEIVADEDLLHHTVEREYLNAYGDVWRTLEAFTEWWQGYQHSTFQFPLPVIPERGGAYRITMETVVTSFGMHPQLQQWNFELSADGSVRVLSVQAIYPKESRWLSYDFRSTIGPAIR